MSGNGVLPARLAAQLAELRSALPDSREDLDRRGFRLLTWPGPDGAAKPTECSLEHEAHLAPEDPAGIGPLLSALHFSEGRSAGEVLVPGDHPTAAWTVSRYDRPPGVQSVDIYFDLPGREIATSGHTLRMRTTYAADMTWNAGDGGLRALNAELPSIVLDVDCGLVARLEFNWFGELARELTMPLSDPTSPLMWLGRSVGATSLAAASPMTRQQTVRLKFGLREHTSDPARERLVVRPEEVVPA
jgi:hypothetical protein